MHPCRFSLGPTKIVNKSLDVKCHAFSYFFEADNVKYKGQQDVDKSKYRVVLRHKETGEVLQFIEKWIAIKPDVEKQINDKTSNNNDALQLNGNTMIPDSKIQQLKVDESSNNLALSDRAVPLIPKRKKLKGRAADFAVQKNAELKGKRINELCVKDMLTKDNKLELQLIAPNDILSELFLSARRLSARNIDELDEMVITGQLFKSVLVVLKKQPVNDLKRIELCIFLNHMLSFYTMPVKTLRTNYPIDDCPLAVMLFLTSCYTEKLPSEKLTQKQPIHFPREQKDKLLTVILALFCYLTDYNSLLGLLQQDLNASYDRIKKQLEVFDAKIIRPLKKIGEEVALNDYVVSTKTPFVDDA